MEVALGVDEDDEDTTVALAEDKVAEGGVPIVAGTPNVTAGVEVDDDVVTGSELDVGLLLDVDNWGTAAPVAAALNAENWFPGLIANTIPFAQ